MLPLRLLAGGGALAAMLAGLRPDPAHAQQQQCTVVFDSVGTFTQATFSGGGQRQRFWDGVFAHCANQPNTKMRADSVEWYSQRGRVDLFGAVRFEDSTVTLDADRAAYFLATERLEAYGDVRLVNRSSGSVLTGPNLIYDRPVPGLRSESRMEATGRPTIEYRTAPDTVEPYVIVGNRVLMRGNDAAWVAGAVTIDRSDFHAVGDSAELQLNRGHGTLVGHAHVEGADSAGYSISGREIGFRFEDSQLHWVQARALAEAESAAWRIVADTLEFSLVEDQIQSGLAWGDSIRPSAVSEDHTITADSLAIDTPNQLLREVRAFGMARATSVRDSVDTGSDWVAGDTVIAAFDTLGTGERSMTSLEARGQAQAFYRIFDPVLAGDPDINYSRGITIVARFGAFGVEQVDVFGQADGIHLVPAGRERP
jgi:hypothetical protein